MHPSPFHGLDARLVEDEAGRLFVAWTSHATADRMAAWVGLLEAVAEGTSADETDMPASIICACVALLAEAIKAASMPPAATMAVIRMVQIAAAPPPPRPDA